MSKPGSHQRVLDAFRDGLIHILLGTQMIAKGLDFPNVTLVGVVNADVGLHLPDFRSRRADVPTARAGRGPRRPRRHAAGTCWCRRSRRSTRASRWRRTTTTPSSRSWNWRTAEQHKYPPFQRMARLIVRSEKEDAASAFADVLATAFKEAMKRSANAQGQTPVRLLGPAECPVFRLNNFYRFHFQVQSDSSAVLHDVLRNVLARRQAAERRRVPGGHRPVQHVVSGQVISHFRV